MKKQSVFQRKKLHELLDYAFKLKDKGHDLFVDYSPHIENFCAAELFMGGWSKKVDPDWHIYTGLPSEVLEKLKSFLKGADK